MQKEKYIMADKEGQFLPFPHLLGNMPVVQQVIAFNIQLTWQHAITTIPTSIGQYASCSSLATWRVHLLPNFITISRDFSSYLE